MIGKKDKVDRSGNRKFNIFRNMKLNFKLIAGFGAVLLLLIAVIGVYRHANNSTNSGFTNLMELEIAIAGHTAKAEILMLQCRRNEKDYLLRHDLKYVKKIDSVIETLSNYPSVSPAGLQQYHDLFLALVATDESIQHAISSLRDSVHNIEPLVEQINLKAIEDTAATMEATQSNANYFSTIAVSIGLSAVVIGIMLAIVIARSIALPIQQAVTFSEKLADGDLTQTLDIDQKDEIGTLARALNHMGVNLRDMFQNIISGVDTLTSSSTKEIAGNVNQAALGIQDVNESVAQSSQVSGTIAEDISNVNQASQEISTGSSQVNMSAEELSQLSEKLSKMVAQFNI